MPERGALDETGRSRCVANRTKLMRRDSGFAPGVQRSRSAIKEFLEKQCIPQPLKRRLVRWMSNGNCGRIADDGNHRIAIGRCKASLWKARERVQGYRNTSRPQDPEVSHRPLPAVANPERNPFP